MTICTAIDTNIEYICAILDRVTGCEEWQQELRGIWWTDRVSQQEVEDGSVEWMYMELL
jgi:hypothetical protein